MKALLCDLKKRNRLEWSLDAFSLGAVLQYCVYRFLKSTMFNFYYSLQYKLFTMGILLLFGGIRYLYVLCKKWKEKDQKERKRFVWNCGFAWLLALPFFYVGWKHDYKWLVLLPICCMCLYDMEADKILKAFVFTIGTLLIATILCCLSGTVRNLVYKLENGRVVGSYGILNTTDFASYATFLLLGIWCCNKTNSLSWNALFVLLSIVATFVIYWYTNSQTSLICGVLITITAIWSCITGYLPDSKFIQKTSKLMRSLLVFAFPIMGMIVLLFVILYGKEVSWAIRINELFSNRLSVILLPYQQYGIQAFGSSIAKMHGLGGNLVHIWTTGYGYIDTAYAMIVICYGWVIMLIITGLWIYMTSKAISYKNHRIAIALAVLAIHAVSEARILDVNYNIFFIMPFCGLNKESYSASRKNVNKPFIAVSTLLLLSIGYCFLPKALSLLRSFFYVKGWNNGLETIKSLATCVIIVLLVFLLWKGIAFFAAKSYKKAIILLGLTIIVGISSVFSVRELVSNQIKITEQERNVVNRITTVATLPVYAAEQEEIYRQELFEIDDHLFSTSEIIRDPQGSIFTDLSTDAVEVTYNGGLYTNISDRSGLYSFDPAVIKELFAMGYEWYPYYSGQTICNLADTAVFNQLTPSNPLKLQGPIKITTQNMEMDQFSGEYEAVFSLSGITESQTKVTGKEPVAVLEVLGEEGETQIIQRELYSEDFDKNGDCKITIPYSIDSTPNVLYAISVREGTTVYVDEISCRRAITNHSRGTSISNDGKIRMQTATPNNRFSTVHLQLYNVASGKHLITFGESDHAGIVSGDYTHYSQEGLFYLRLQTGSNLADEWIQRVMFIEEGETLHYSYNLEEIESNCIVISDPELNDRTVWITDE